MLRRGLKLLCSSVGKIDRYDPKQFRGRINKRVVCRKKSFAASRIGRIIDYLRPSTVGDISFFDNLEMSKVAFVFIFPIVMLLYWKNSQETLPTQWEKDCQGLQNRQFKEENTSTQSQDYFTIIDDFQKRQSLALEKKRKEQQKM